MTASDHLKHRTGSLGGDQIPEDLSDIYQHAIMRSEQDVVQLRPYLVQELIERIAKAEAALAQKTRECEELKESQKPKCPDCNAVGMRHCSDPENCGGLYWPDSLYRALEAQVEQLQRQVAEMSRPVTLEEWQAASLSTAKTFREMASTVLASRARTK